MFCALTLHPQNVDASPRDLNCLKDTAGGDIRTLDKLYDNVNSTYDDSHMWLTVFDGKRNGNTVYTQIHKLFKIEISISFEYLTR